LVLFFLQSNVGLELKRFFEAGNKEIGGKKKLGGY